MVEEMSSTNPGSLPDDSPFYRATAPGFEVRLKSAAEIVEKHGYYYSVLPDDEKIAYVLAASCEGFEQEVLLLKAKLTSIQFYYPFNFALIARFIALLERLQRAQKTLFKKDSDAKAPKGALGMFGNLPFPPGPLGQRLQEALGIT